MEIHLAVEVFLAEELLLFLQCQRSKLYKLISIPFSSDTEDSWWLMECKIPTNRILDLDINEIFAPTIGNDILFVSLKADFRRASRAKDSNLRNIWQF